MKRFSFIALIALAACGGGGGSTAPPVTSQPAPPAPTATPTPIANTSLPYYAPFALSNRWVFNNGAVIVDNGPNTLSCACAVNGLKIEYWDEFGPPDGTTYGNTIVVAKMTSGQTGSLLDTLIGTSKDHGKSITLLTDGTNYGIPFMDDAAFLGETWQYTDATSTITAVNGSQAYPAGAPTAVITNVNQDTLAGQGLSLVWSFARGVGPTALTYQGQTIQLVSFTVSPNSQSETRRTSSYAARLQYGRSAGAALLSVVRTIF